MADALPLEKQGGQIILANILGTMNAQLVKLSDYTSPDWSDLFIDALHIAISDKLEKNPRLLGIAVHNLSLWRQKHPEQRKLVRQWKLIVYTWDFSDILAFLREASPAARELRRASPFCGILTAEEIARTVFDAGVEKKGGAETL